MNPPSLMLLCFLLLFGVSACSASKSAELSNRVTDFLKNSESGNMISLAIEPIQTRFIPSAEGLSLFSIDTQDLCVNELYLQESLRKISGSRSEDNNSSHSTEYPSKKTGIDDLVEFVRSQQAAYSTTVGPLQLSPSCGAFLATKGSRLERLFYVHGVYDKSATFKNCRSNTPFCSRTIVDGPQTGRRMEEVLMAYLPYVPDFPKLEFIDRISRAYDLEAQTSGFAPWQYKDVETCPRRTFGLSYEYYDCFLLRAEILDKIVYNILYLKTQQYRHLSKEAQLRTGQYVGCSDLLKIIVFYASNSRNLDSGQQIERWLSNLALEC